MARIRETNFVTIQSYMVTDLKLKGNELIIYAIINGFCQDGEHKFNGSLQYLADWTNSTKQGVIKNLKSLVEKGYIIKNSENINGVNKVEYYTTMFNRGIKQSLIGGIKQSLTNNIYIDKIEDIKEIIDYLNTKLNTNYKSNTKQTQSMINARFKEGFTVEDFKMVIDKKYKEWLNTEFEQYLTPQTLFGTKFEKYLNQKTTKEVDPYAGIPRL